MTLQVFASIALKMEKLLKTTCKLSVRLGSQRTRLTQVHSFGTLPTEEEILDCLEDYGYGTEYGYARLIWQNEKGQAVRSVSLSKPLMEEDGQSTVKVLVDGLRVSLEEMKKKLSMD